MSEDREQLNDRYLEAQLREELGIDPDLSENVLHAVYGKPRRVIPGPRKPAPWRPLAAAAVVLIAAGAATYALVQILPTELGQRDQRAQRAVHREQPAPAETPQPKPEPKQPQAELPQKPAPSDPADAPQPEPTDEPKPVKVPIPKPKGPDDVVDDPKPHNPPWMDPPDSWPQPKQPVKEPEDTAPKERAVVAASWKGESLRVTRDGQSLKWKSGDHHQLLEGDQVVTKGAAEFVLNDGSLLRLDGEMTFGMKDDAPSLLLHDGVLYADTVSALVVETAEVKAHLTGVAVVEERLHGMDVFCVAGSVSSGGRKLTAGLQSRLEKDGFGREKAITWADVQREFRFLKDTPSRTALVEELNEVPGELFGGKLVDGVLVGDVDGDTGLGFYLRESYEFRAGDVVRFRFRVAKACEMVLQFGTVGDDNWRHKMGGVKAGEWIEYELPLADLYKTTDVARKAAPGLKLKFFQLHPEDGTARIDLDRVEIVHRP